MKLRGRQTSWILNVLGALRFHDTDEQGLRLLAESNWPSLLAATDQAHLTLPLAVRCPFLFPADAQKRLERTLADNALCHKRLASAYLEIEEAFRRHNVDFLVLKGLAQWPWYVDDPRHRRQSDIDLYCPPASMTAALSALEELGYRAVHGDTGSALDHLPVMIRRTGWTWRGDYYDPDRPPSVELHFRFWDTATEGFAAGDPESFLRRRDVRDIGGLPTPTLSLPDGLTYSAMHLVRHLLRGDLQVRHVYELAHFLERSAADDAFWNHWEKSTMQEERLVEAIAFRLATEWFVCRPHSAAHRLMEQISLPVRRWFELFALSPATRASEPNKDELWLHLCLVSNSAARRKIALRRLFPARRQRVILEPHLQPGQGSPTLPLRRVLYEASFLMNRALHHLRALSPVLRSGLRWWRAGATSL